MRIKIASCAERALTSTQPLRKHIFYFTHKKRKNCTANESNKLTTENACAHCSNNNYHYQFLYSVAIFSLALFVTSCGIVVDHWHFIDWNVSKNMCDFYSISVQFKRTVKRRFQFKWNDRLKTASPTNLPLMTFNKMRKSEQNGRRRACLFYIVDCLCNQAYSMIEITKYVSTLCVGSDHVSCDFRYMKFQLGLSLPYDTFQCLYVVCVCVFFSILIHCVWS